MSYFGKLLSPLYFALYFNESGGPVIPGTPGYIVESQQPATVPTNVNAAYVSLKPTVARVHIEVLA